MILENVVDVVARSKTTVDVTYAIYQEINKYILIKYNNEDLAKQNRNKEIDFIFHLGLIQAKQNLSSDSSSLLHKERKPRKDVWEKLGRIAKEFLDCTAYPKIPGGAISQILNKVLPNRDPRVIKDYRKTVLSYCNVQEDIIKRCTNDSRLGELNVSFFVELIPKQYITTSSTSSCGEELERWAAREVVNVLIMDTLDFPSIR